MKARNTVLTLAIGATLALGASSANATVAGQADSLGASASSHYSAAALNALNLRWEAIGKAYRLQHTKGTGSGIRPDDRAGLRGI
jgi:hypothetical protein